MNMQMIMIINDAQVTQLNSNLDHEKTITESN